jgi:hypothetical protein
MNSAFGERTRYALYALLAALGVFAYFALSDDEQAPIQATARRTTQNEVLPQLHLVETDVRRDPARDLFAFFKAVQIEEQASLMEASRDPIPAPTVQPEGLDALAGIQVLGLVRNPDSVTILLRDNNTLMTVALGERFGTGNALYVKSIEGKTVIVIDSASRASRSFELSEE